METRQLGSTGIVSSRLGIGLAEIGRQLTWDQADQAGQVLNLALDLGVTFLDTAANYAISEELVGKSISHRRSEYTLSTKCGNRVVDSSDRLWTAETVRKSIERSLRVMQTDRLDIVFLHSCTLAVLEEGSVIRALQEARREGKTRFIGYSGDNEAAEWAVRSGLFDALETSFNLVDQKARRTLFPEARSRGMAVIAKRAFANGAWGVLASPSEYAEEYFRRAQAMGSQPVRSPREAVALALGFVLAHEEVDVALMGTRSPGHVAENVSAAQQDPPLSRRVAEDIRERFDRVGADWPQMN
jgi:aryl-alcohol dehydrogenase-like predicted oxidoreductase